MIRISRKPRTVRVMLLAGSVLALVHLQQALAPAAPPSLVEISVGNQTRVGKIVAHDKQSFWLQQQDGRLERHRVDQVKRHREVSPQFRSWSSSIVRDQLRREFGSGYEIAGTRHYLVCARTSDHARRYAELFEEIYRGFHLYFSVRGFNLPEPEFPLVAIVFPDHASFARYADRDNFKNIRNVLGYYSGQTNRVALYESAPPGSAQRDAPAGLFAEPFAGDRLFASVNGDLQSTIVHEATHQVAFNTGLHARIGSNPQWVVEGLATTFEAAGIRNSGSGLTPKARINPDRFTWFGNYRKTRRPANSLAAFVSTDAAFSRDAMDAYSEAWALTFFLIETRPRAYAQYLSGISKREPLSGYSEEQRLTDFKKAFGNELRLLEAEFLRFHAGIR